MLNRFCVFFRKPLSDVQSAVFRSFCEQVESIFDASYEVDFSGSFSLFRYTMKTEFSDLDYYLVVPKKTLSHVNRVENDGV